MKTYKEKLKNYCDKTHEYDMQSAIEKLIFEINIQKKIFDEDLGYEDLQKLYADVMSTPVFSKNEWEHIVNSALNNPIKQKSKKI